MLCLVSHNHHNHSYPYPSITNLHSLHPPRLNRQTTHRNRSSQHQRPRDINRRFSIPRRRINSNKRCTKPRDPIQTASDPRPRAPDRRREELGRVGVQHAVGDILEEGFETGADELRIWGWGRCEAEEDHARDHGRDCHCALAADVFDVYCVAGQKGAGHADNRCDGVVAVCHVH